MRADVPELIFPSREAFRDWLQENAQSSKGVWLVFGKTKAVITLTANDALEEALCYGWIDGQMRSIDETRYHKYFARRNPKSVWSEKNKKIVESLRERELMTALGEEAVEAAVKNGMWDAPKNAPLSNEQQEAFAVKLSGFSPAYENFCNMPPSVQRTYALRYYSFKTEAAQERDFEKIVDRLNNNLKPM